MRSVSGAALGDISTFAKRLKAIQRYAQAEGFAGGFPSYVDNPDQGTIGVVLLKSDVATPEKIAADELR